MKSVVQQALSRESFEKFSHRILLVYCLIAALSIALAQILLIAFIVYWLLFLFRQRVVPPALPAADFAPSLLFWTLIAVIAAAAGVDLSRAAGETLRTLFYLLLPFAVFHSFAHETVETAVVRMQHYLTALAGSQILAALHTVVSSALGFEVPPTIPGPLIESGLIVLILPALVALLLWRTQDEMLFDVSFFRIRLPVLIPCTFVLLFLLVFCWPQAVASPYHVNSSSLRVVAVLAAVSVTALTLLAVSRDSTSDRFRTSLLWFGGALIVTALLVNLKRGPWFGVAAFLLLIGLLLRRRSLSVAVLAACVVLFSLGPIRSRILHYRNDFMISGGRKVMWSLGTEIVSRFPLGLGLGNARFMRELDPSLPASHRHMHNNLLNVTVETGWLGLLAYLWWMFVVIRMGIAAWWRATVDRGLPGPPFAVLALVLSLAILGWQLAGVVEYNFGTGQIRLLALFYMGLLLVAVSRTSAQSEERADNQLHSHG